MGEYADMPINDEIAKACKVGDAPPPWSGGQVPTSQRTSSNNPDHRRTIAEQVADGTLTDRPKAGQKWRGVGDPTPRKTHPVEGVAQPWNGSNSLPSGLPQLLVGQKAACTVCGLDNFTVSMDRGRLRLRDENGFWHGCDPAEKVIDDEIQTVKEIPF